MFTVEKWVWKKYYHKCFLNWGFGNFLITFLELWVVGSLGCRWKAVLNDCSINTNRLSESIFQDTNNQDSCIMEALFYNLKVKANSLCEMKNKHGAKLVFLAYCESLFLWLQLLLLAELSVFFLQSSLSCCWYIAWERRMKAVTTLVNVNHPVLPIKRHLLRSFMHKIPI